MKFRGNGIVWPVGKFVNGVLETDDPAKIEVLLRAGFTPEAEPTSATDPVKPVKKGATKK